jgi:hypothetical protein
VGLTFGLLLWLQQLTQRWSDPVDWLFPLASIAAVMAVNSWEARDELPRPNALVWWGFAAVFAPGLFLAMLDWLRDPSVLRFLTELFQSVLRTFSILGRTGWALFPALYSGAVLCRRKHRIRPRTDLYFWTLTAGIAAALWLRPETGLFAQPLRTPEDRAWTHLAGAAAGLLIGWRFSRTGYPPAR